MSQNEETLQKVNLLLQSLRCNTCHAQAHVLLLHLSAALCTECYEWIFMVKEPWISNGQEIGRTFSSREVFLELQAQKFHVGLDTAAHD